MDNNILNLALDDMKTEAGETGLSPNGGGPSSLIAGAVADTAAETSARNRATAMSAMSANPEMFADYNALSVKTGIPVEMVARNHEEIKKWADLNDVSGLLDGTPQLADWYAKDDNTDAIKVDELREMSGLKWLGLSALQSVVGGVRSVNGTLVAGVVLGIVNAFASYFIGAYFTLLILLLVVALTILLRPQGLFARLT